MNIGGAINIASIKGMARQVLATGVLEIQLAARDAHSLLLMSPT